MQIKYIYCTELHEMILLFMVAALLMHFQPEIIQCPLSI